jgi:hypothetical protein
MILASCLVALAGCCSVGAQTGQAPPSRTDEELHPDKYSQPAPTTAPARPPPTAITTASTDTSRRFADLLWTPSLEEVVRRKPEYAPLLLGTRGQDLWLEFEQHARATDTPVTRAAVLTVTNFPGQPVGYANELGHRKPVVPLRPSGLLLLAIYQTGSRIGVLTNIVPDALPAAEARDILSLEVSQEVKRFEIDARDDPDLLSALHGFQPAKLGHPDGITIMRAAVSWDGYDFATLAWSADGHAGVYLGKNVLSYDDPESLDVTPAADAVVHAAGMVVKHASSADTRTTGQDP